MPIRGRRRTGGITVTDQRRDGLGKSSAVAVSPLDFDQLANEGRNAVFNLLSTHSGIDEVSIGLGTEARNAIYNILSNGGFDMAVNFYNTHNVANLQLPAVTVESVSSKQLTGDIALWQSDEQVNHAVIVNVRVHTGYVNAEPDPTESTQLMDEVLKVLKTNLNKLENNYRIMEVPIPNYSTVFDLTRSIGAEMNLELHRVISYEQET